VKERFKIGVIISTYNSPQWLEKTLWGYENQTIMPDEIIIADDGSKEETRKLVETFISKLPIKYVWHEDEGFQKSRILNKAIVLSTSDYLIFTDQDCIPRNDFVETHIKYAQKGYFLSADIINSLWILVFRLQKKIYFQGTPLKFHG
jgi:glycosyltransferase involved in cell wall biosynthesis